MAVDVKLLQFMADMRAQGTPTPAAGDTGDSLETPNPNFLNQPNFDVSRYEAERHAVSMKVISDRMNAARKPGQKIESVSNGAWSPHRDFLKSGRDPHAAWKRR